MPPAFACLECVEFLLHEIPSFLTDNLPALTDDRLILGSSERPKRGIISPMRSNVCQRKIFLRPGAVVVSFAVLLVNLPSAHAGCGDYVIRKSDSSKTKMTEVSNSSMSMTHSPASHHRNRHPCSGPSCSNGQSSPVLPLPPTTPDHEEWAIQETSQEPCIELSGFLSVPSIFHPAIELAEIFHPPRRG